MSVTQAIETEEVFLPGQSLTDAHREYLVNAGVNPKFLDSAAALIRSSETLSDLRFPPVPGQRTKPWDHLSRPEGIMFGWKNLAGEITWQFRPDHPEADEKGRLKKYLFPEDSTSRYGIRSDAGSGSPLWIVEGTKQSLAVASYIGDEVTVIGIPGCSGWSEGGWAVPGDLIKLARRRRVYVLLDADASENFAVYKAGEKLADRLSAAAKELRFIPCPGGDSQGIDDYLAELDDDDREDFLLDLPDTALTKPAKRKPAERKRKSLLERETEREHLEKARADAAERALAAFSDGADVNDEERRLNRSADGSIWLRDTGGLAVASLGNAMLESSTPVATTASGTIAVYSKRGVYVAEDKALNAVATALLSDHYSRANRDTLGEWLDGTCVRESKVLPVGRTGKPYVNFLNGMLHLDTLELHPHDPSYMSTRQIPVEWNPDATCPTYEEWLRDRVGDRQVAVIEEAISQFLDESRPPMKGLFLFGPSRSGKGTMIRLAQEMLGGEHSPLVSATTLHQLSDDRFAAAELYGKALNISADLSKKHISDLSVFKMMLGQDPIPANKKYGSMFVYHNSAMFLMSANSIPTVGEESNAYINRLVPGAFPKTYEGNENPDIEDALIEELPGIAVRWVKARRDHRARRWRWLTPPNAVTAAFGQASDRVARFVADCCEVGGTASDEVHREGGNFSGTGGWCVGSLAPLSELHLAFKAWADDESASGMGRSTFKKRLQLIPGFQWELDPIRSGGRVTNLILKPKSEWGNSDFDPDSPDDLIRALFPGEPVERDSDDADGEDLDRIVGLPEDWTQIVVPDSIKKGK